MVMLIFSSPLYSIFLFCFHSQYTNNYIIAVYVVVLCPDCLVYNMKVREPEWSNPQIKCGKVPECPEIKFLYTVP